MIHEHTAKGHEAPVAMQAVWNWEHERMVEETAHIKMLLNELKS